MLVVAVVCTLAVAGTYGYGLICQLAFGEPFGTRPTSDEGLVFGVVVSTAVCLGVLVLIWICRLETEVRRDGLFVRFFPFHQQERKIKLEGLSSFGAVEYRPIWEYGGWGMRWRPGGRAYNVRGRRGVKMEFENGKHLLIGSQRAEELEGAIRKMMETEKSHAG